MAISIWAIGLIILSKGMVCNIITAGIYTKGFGETIRSMGMESITMTRDECIKASGLRIKSKVRVFFI